MTSDRSEPTPDQRASFERRNQLGSGANRIHDVDALRAMQQRTERFSHKALRIGDDKFDRSNLCAKHNWNPYGFRRDCNFTAVGPTQALSSPYSGSLRTLLLANS